MIIVDTNTNTTAVPITKRTPATQPLLPEQSLPLFQAQYQADSDHSAQQNHCPGHGATIASKS
jgi:hypothetical protein